jgi:hypothetical protein
MKKAIMSNCKDSRIRSNKSCVCGGHNKNNRKRSRKARALSKLKKQWRKG